MMLMIDILLSCLVVILVAYIAVSAWRKFPR